MSLRDLALYTMTGFTPASTPPEGGTAVDLALSPVPVQNGLQLIFADDVGTTNRRSVTFRSKPATYDPKTKTWSKQKRSISLSEPRTNEITGAMQSAALRIELDVPADFTIEKCEEFLTFGLQMINRNEVYQFWTIGSPE